MLLSVLSGVACHPLSAFEITDQLRQIQPDIESGRYFAARDTLLQLATTHSSLSRLQLELALIEIQLEDYNSALERLSSVLADPELPDTVRVQVQLLYLSTRRQQTSHRNAGVDGYLQLSYLPAIELGQLEGQLRYHRNDKITTLNMQGYPLHLGRLASVKGVFYNDTFEDSSDLRLDLSTGIQARLRSLTLDTQIGLIVATQEQQPYFQMGIRQRYSRQLTLAYRLKGIWNEHDGNSWQHRFTGVWFLNTSWSTKAQFTIEDTADGDEYPLYWEAAVTRLGSMPVTLDIVHSETNETRNSQLNLSAEWEAAPRWRVRPTLGYWTTQDWQGWRYSIGAQWTP